MSSPNIIKRALSHLIELPVGEYSSQYNPHLKVVLHRGRYKLITNGAIYSFSDLYSNFRKAFERLEWEAHPVKSCLVLGLGLGSIPDMLVTKFQKNIRFTAVEIDELIISLAMELVLKPKNIPVQLFTADATSFLDWHNGKYDMICSDVFVEDRIPQALQTEEALDAMKDMLKPDGLLLYNRLSRYGPDIAENEKFKEIFLSVFPKGGYLDVDGNWMFVNRIASFSVHP